MSNDSKGDVVVGVLIFFAVLLALTGIVFGITCGIKGNDTKSFNRDDQTGCLVVTYKERHTFGADHNNSGTYCKVVK
jgi:hypothetical protein